MDAEGLTEIRAGHVVAFANQKGGVGKTTTAVNLGACLAELGRRVLLVDLDPQGNASTGVGVDRATVKIGTYEVLAGSNTGDAIVGTPAAGLDVLPSTLDLAGAEIELTSAFAREGKLRAALAAVRGRYDFVLVDSPPSLGLLTVNALTAADAVCVPIQCEYYALEGLGQLLRTIELVRESLNPQLALGGVALTMFDARTKLAEQVAAEVRLHFGGAVFESVIPRSVRLSEAPGFGKPVILYDGASRGAQAYRALAREALGRWEPRPAEPRPAEPQPAEPQPAAEPPENAVASVACGAAPGTRESPAPGEGSVPDTEGEQEWAK
ncbi:MAG: AAA family ATPase [Acidobacteria bacterium]|nr:AAA family ATPase [Acidobacteriota bacterium]